MGSSSPKPSEKSLCNQGDIISRERKKGQGIQVAKATCWSWHSYINFHLYWGRKEALLESLFRPGNLMKVALKIYIFFAIMLHKSKASKGQTHQMLCNTDNKSNHYNTDSNKGMPVIFPHTYVGSENIKGFQEAKKSRNTSFQSKQQKARQALSDLFLYGYQKSEGKDWSKWMI